MSPPHDPQPAARLVEHRAAALAYANRKYRGLSAADREDIVQEAIANVLQRLRRGPLENPLPYLLRVVYTLGAEALRDPRRGTLSLDSHGDGLDGVERFADRSVTPLSPEELVLARHDAADVRRVLLQRLSVQERRALALRSVAELTPAQIAADLGVSVRRYRRLREEGARKLASGVASIRAPSASFESAIGPPGGEARRDEAPPVGVDRPVHHGQPRAARYSGGRRIDAAA